MIYVNDNNLIPRYIYIYDRFPIKTNPSRGGGGNPRVFSHKTAELPKDHPLVSLVYMREGSAPSPSVLHCLFEAASPFNNAEGGDYA